MDSQWLWVLLGVGELLSVLVLLLLVSWFRNQAARRRDKRAISALVAGTRKGKEARLAEISAFLSGQFGMRDEALGLAVRTVYKAEVGLIQAFASTYLQRDAQSAANFRGKIEAGNEPYWALSGEAGAASESASSDATEATDTNDDVPADDGEIKRLQGENVRLSEELRVTMDTMSRMLTEYSTIFAKDGAVADITVVDEADSLPDSPTEVAAATPEAAVEAVPADAADAEMPTEPDAILAVPEAAEDDDPDAIFAAASAAPSSEAVATGPVTDVDESEAVVDPDAILAALDAVEDDDPDAIFAAASAAPAGDAVATGPATDVDEAEADVDSNAILAETDVVDDDDPDAIFATASEPMAATADPVDEDEAVRFAVDLDSDMKDLSDDDEAVSQALDLGDEDTDEEVLQAKAAAERNRIIDADS